MNVVWMKQVILISRRDYKAAADKKKCTSEYLC